MTPLLRNWLYTLSLTPGIIVVIGNLQGGIWALGNVFYSLVILGLTEVLAGDFLSQKHSGKQDIIPNLVLWLHVPLQVACILSFVYGVRENILMSSSIFYAALSMGIYSGSGAIVMAHEFIHRKDKLWRLAGRFLLFTAGNFYFYIEHLRVHHKWVGTDKDSATARRGQSVYGFFYTSATGQIKSAWKLECERCKKEYGSGWFLRHYMIRQLFLHLIFDAALFMLAGPLALIAWFLQCIVANFLLEYVNYIEHYGLSRNENERVTEIHSWQSDKLVSRFILVDLSRHADHHYYASKAFHTLSSYEKSPVLPGGYASLIVPALVPPLWRKLTHPILDHAG